MSETNTHSYTIIRLILDIYKKITYLQKKDNKETVEKVDETIVILRE
jgi:hypothetical protein